MILKFEFLLIFLANIILGKNISKSYNSTAKYSYSELGDHTVVTDSNVFPYVVAILKKYTYLSAGALINENWVITAADSLFLIRESSRVIRVKLGTINYKKGGLIVPIKFFEIHPYFRDTNPEFDVALVMLARPVKTSYNLSPIRMQQRTKEVTATHFIVTSWPTPQHKDSEDLQSLRSIEEIKRHRILKVFHLHPSEAQVCAEEMEALDVNSTDTIMCLDTPAATPTCVREAGAPVVLDGVLWGVISSFKAEDCDLEAGPSFVNLVAANSISSWIHSILNGHRWSNDERNDTNIETQEENTEENDDIDDNIDK